MSDAAGAALPLMTDSHDHPLRRYVDDEIHARPVPPLRPPARVAYLAFKQPQGAAERDRAPDLAHARVLFAALGVDGAPTDASNHTIGRRDGLLLKWERHTEFVSYLLAIEDDAVADLFSRFEHGWISAAPGKVLVAIDLQLDAIGKASEPVSQVQAAAGERFDPSALAMSLVHGGQSIIATDFGVDESGLTRMWVGVPPHSNPARVGRLAQRLIEIHTYQTLAMLALPRAREAGARLAALEISLTEVVQGLGGCGSDDHRSLGELLRINAGVQAIGAAMRFRFGASQAYQALVDERIAELREQRIEDQQKLSEFSLRRFLPAMRTVRSVQQRIDSLSDQGLKAGELLSTRVGVANEQSQRELLQSMDKRADAQLRLQETVEGLSVVAISYYAISIGGYLFGPLAKLGGFDKSWLMAALALPVLWAVRRSVRHIRARLGGAHNAD